MVMESVQTNVVSLDEYASAFAEQPIEIVSGEVRAGVVSQISRPI
jgi:hypothetical protein